MAEYIEREELLKRFNSNDVVHKMDNENFRYKQGYLTGLITASVVAKAMPSADVVEVKHGKWEKQQFIGRSGFFSVKDFTCSNCFESFAVEQGKGLMNYCPNCGARMERENNEKVY